MKESDRHQEGDAQSVKPSRRARLEALLFAGAALGTTVLTMAAMGEPKVPRLVGE